MPLLLSLASRAPRASTLLEKQQQQKQRQASSSPLSSPPSSPLTPKTTKTLSSPRGRLAAFRPPSASPGGGGGGGFPPSSPRGGGGGDDNQGNRSKREREEDEADLLLQKEYPLLAPPPSSSSPPPLVPVLSRDAERTVGRTAMLGFACAVAGEVIAGGGGPLSQLKLSGLLPHFALDALLAGACASGLLFALSPVVGVLLLFIPIHFELERKGEEEEGERLTATPSFSKKLK